MAGVDVASITNTNNKMVRKWGTQLLAVADYSTAMPASFFDTDGRPAALPNGFKVLGYITTDGITVSRSIDSEDTNMVQDLEPVRSDVTGRTRTLKCTFGEMNAWVKALAHGVPVAQWPENKDGDWEYTDGKIADFPYLRVIIIMQDGVGDDARYRVEAAYRAKISDQGDVTKNRSDAEGEDTTFTCFRDPVTDKSYYEGEHGPKK